MASGVTTDSNINPNDNFLTGFQVGNCDGTDGFVTGYKTITVSCNLFIRKGSRTASIIAYAGIGAAAPFSVNISIIYAYPGDVTKPNSGLPGGIR